MLVPLLNALSILTTATSLPLVLDGFHTAAATSVVAGRPLGLHPVVRHRRPNRAPGWLSPQAVAGHRELFIADADADRVQVLDAHAPYSVIGSLTSGVSFPLGLAVDKRGDLYVANEGADNVLVFAPGATAPTRVLTGLEAPSNIAVAPDGTVYVAEFSQSAVAVILPGTTSPARAIRIAEPVGLALDHSGTLYVASHQTPAATGVFAFPHGASRGYGLGLRLAGIASGLQVERNGDLQVGNGSYIDTFPTNVTGMTPTQTLAVGDVYDFAYDRDQSAIYTSEPARPLILIVANTPAGQQLGSITSGFTSCYGVAFRDAAPAARP